MLCWNTGWRNFILGLMEHCFVPHVKSYMVAAENWSIRCFAWRTARGRQGIWMPPGSCLSGAKAWLAMTAASTTTARAHGVASQCLRPSPCGRPCTATGSFCPQRNAPRGRPVCWPTGNGCTAISAPGFESNINYYAAGAGALAVLGRDYDCPDWSAHADELAQFCLARISPEGLLCGEGKPIDAVTAKGCRPVDIGYNLEESLPGLLQYARARENTAVLAQVHELFRAHAAFLLPDGGMDNSFGTRNFKWTYWGSRTSEGGAYALAWLGQTDPALQSAAARELALWEKTTHGGLLTGGPDYAKRGQPGPGIHHAFSHAKALAELVDDGLTPQDTAPLPRETAAPLTAYPVLDTYLVHVGDWMATVTGYDFRYLKGGHVSGGTLSLLYHQNAGVLAASAMTRYSLYEAHNMQQSGALAAQGSLTPRLQSGRFASCLDESAVLHAEENGDIVEITVQGYLRDEDQTPAAPYRFAYRFARDGVRLTAEVAAGEAELLLPLTDSAAVQGAEKGRPVFSLAGGFAMTEYRAMVRAGTPVTVCIGCG